MTDGAGDPAPAIEALRARGAARLDPVGLRFIEALARRSAAQGSEARRLLEQRLARALAECGARCARALAEAGNRREAREGSGPLAALLGRLGEDAAAGELKSLRHFGGTWKRLSVHQAVALALAHAPENAGPLNSHFLVLQSLELMRDVSPAYLERFLPYVDALLWLEQADGGRGPELKDAGRAEGGRKRKPGRDSGG